MSNKKFFQLFENCIPVKGAKNSIICDLQFNRYRPISNLLVDVLIKNKGRSVDETKLFFNHLYDKGIDSFFDYFNDNDWGFYSREPVDLPKMDLSYETVEPIKNAIFDIDKSSNYDLLGAIQKLSLVGCPELQIRFFRDVYKSELDDVLSVIADSPLLALDLVVPYGDHFSHKDIEILIGENLIIRKMVIYNAPKFHKIDLGTKIYHGTALFVKQSINSCEHCGFVSKEYFVTEMRLFTEALKFNTCLNKKVSVDVKGNVKNCPSMENSFGSISNVDLKTISESKDFQAIWDINKDQIEVCKDCEFRYVCTDCRAYRKEPSNLLSKPLKCDYDPYVGEWRN